MKGIVVGEQVIVNAVDSNFKAVPNIDARYGPYDSIDEALNAIPSNMRSIGTTIGIIDDNNIIKEYWFNGGVEDSNLIHKLKILDSNLDSNSTLQDVINYINNI